MRLRIALTLIAGLVAAGSTLPAAAATPCTFSVTGSTMTLDADCTTDTTILVPDGFTLDGGGNTITAVDPPGGFLGAVVANAGASANVIRLNVTASGLANACKGLGNRLRGIMFEGASGRIAHNNVAGINKGASGCQEGNGIEVRNAPFDGSHPGTVDVEIHHNTVTDYQKTGILANGDVRVHMHHNTVGASATQDNLAANSIQLGFGALGSVVHNQVDGNQWKGTSNFAATAILIFMVDGANALIDAPIDVSKNNVRGNADVGLYIYANGGTYDNNRVFDEGPDHPNSGYDIGIGSYGTGTSVTNNKVRGYATAYDGVVGGNNKTIPSP